MGCKSSKSASKSASAPQPVADKAAAGGTLLATQNAGKAVSQTDVVQHRMMRIPIKPDALGAMLEIAQGAEMREALNQLQGMMDLEITKVADEDVIFTHSRWQDQASMQAAEAKIGELLKPMGAHFAGAPERFYATGGSVHLSGQSVWTFVPNVAAATEEPAAAKQEAEEEAQKIVEEEQEPISKLTRADEEQEVVVDADQAVAAATEEAAAATEEPAAAKQEVEEAQKIAEKEQELIYQLTEADDAQLVVVDADQAFREVEKKIAPGSWFFGSCCVANL